MIKNSWNMGQAALAISLFLSVCGASATWANDAQGGAGGYVNGLYAQAANSGNGTYSDACDDYWCDQCRCRHSRRAMRRNAACYRRGCRNGHCPGGHCLGGKCYRPVDGYYNDPRDSEVYSAVGYNIPVSVPLAPVVKYQYNYGWGLPSTRLVQVGNQYTQYYPQPFVTQTGGRVPAGPPTIYQPTDTTQTGFYYGHVPHWTPVRRINTINYYSGW